MKKGIMKKSGSYVRKSSFLKSFRIDKRRFLVSVLTDIVYFGAVFFSFIFLMTMIGPKLPTVLSAQAMLEEQRVMLEEGEASDVDALYANIDSIIAATRWIIIYFVVFLIAFVLLNSALKTFSWSRLAKKRFSAALFLRSVALNLMLFSFFVLVFRFILMPFISANEPTLFMIILVIVAYFMLLMLNVHRIMLVREGRIFRSIAGSYKIIALRFYLFFIPLFLMFLMLLPVTLLANIFAFIPWGLGVALTFVTVVLYLNWCKNYFNVLVTAIADKMDA